MSILKVQLLFELIKCLEASRGAENVTLNATVVGSIPTPENEIFLFLSSDIARQSKAWR